MYGFTGQRLMSRMSDSIVVLQTKKRQKIGRLGIRIMTLLSQPGLTGYTSREIAYELGKFIGTISGALHAMKKKKLIRVNCTRMCTISHTMQWSYVLGEME